MPTAAGGAIVAIPMPPKPRLSHVGPRNRPAMVDVGDKPVTRRRAHAVALVRLPAALARLLSGGEIRSAKGPVFQASVLAGIMGAKRTSELVPLCHPLPLDDCRIEIRVRPRARSGPAWVEIHCHVSAEARTGVEMEAMTGVCVAALALYDMGKSAGHGIEIRRIRLLEKTGGKKDYRAR